MRAIRLEGDLLRVMGAAGRRGSRDRLAPWREATETAVESSFRNITGVADLVTSTLVQNGFVDFERT